MDSTLATNVQIYQIRLDIHFMIYISIGIFGYKPMGHLFSRYLVVANVSAIYLYRPRIIIMPENIQTSSARERGRESERKTSLIPLMHIPYSLSKTARRRTMSHILSVLCFHGLPMRAAPKYAEKFNPIQSVCKNNNKSFDSCTFGLI